MNLANSVKRVTHLILLLMLPCMSCLADQTAKADGVSSSATVKLENEQKRPRLKYRSGPVCMCSQGMSEADIQAAKKKQDTQ